MSRPRKFWVVIFFCIGLLISLGAVSFGWWKEQYPNYLIFQPKHTFQNNFYLLEMTSFITQFWFQDYHMGKIDGQVCAYYRMLTLEEGYNGQWNLEAFNSFHVLGRDKTKQEEIVETFSHLYTFSIHKYWTFKLNEPYFTVTITKTYLLNSTSENNQIIIDINNESWKLDNASQFTFHTKHGDLTIEILNSKPNLTFQEPSTTYPTELQLNFYGESGSVKRSHVQGEQETVTLKISVSDGNF